MLEVVDLAQTPLVRAETEVMQLAEEFVEERISWDSGPLFAARLFRLCQDEYVLVISVDHMITDGVSNVILSDEILALYTEMVGGLPSSLPRVPLQFADYAVWQQQIHENWLREHEEYWKARLVRAPTIQLPFDKVKAESKSEYGIGGMTRISFDLSVTVGIHDLARRERTVPAMVMLTAYVATISRWCNQRDIIVMFVEAGRSTAELIPMVGWLVNHLHLRIEISTKDSFLDLLSTITAEFYRAQEHQDFNRVPLLIPECTTDLYFNWLPDNNPGWLPNQPIGGKHELRIRPFSVKQREIPPFPLGTFLSQDTSGFVATVCYRADLFLADTIIQFGRNLNSTASEMTSAPNAHLFCRSGISR